MLLAIRRLFVVKRSVFVVLRLNVLEHCLLLAEFQFLQEHPGLFVLDRFRAEPFVYSLLFLCHSYLVVVYGLRGPDAASGFVSSGGYYSLWRSDSAKALA